MPFTVGGEWVPNKQPHEVKSTKPVKVRLVKRGKNVLTVVLNLNLSGKELVELASHVKRKLGCGGAVKEDSLEIQGDQIDQVKAILLEKGIKSS